MNARILVIEDNQANIDLMVYLIEASGHSALVARNGEDGLQLVRQERPDLIVCDIQMPKLNGYEVARILKADPELQRIPLLAVTAFAMVGDREKAVSSGFDSYLSKPIDPETFIRELETFLDPVLGAAAAPQQDAPLETRGNGAHPSPRILVVDNDRTNLDLAASLLGLAGYTVDTNTDPDTAFASALAAKPDLIISDVCMPTSSGFEFIKKIKDDPGLRSIPFVFLTSTATDERARREGLALGAAHYLFRPIEMQVLLEIVDRCLGSNGDDSG